MNEYEEKARAALAQQRQQYGGVLSGGDTQAARGAGRESEVGQLLHRLHGRTSELCGMVETLVERCQPILRREPQTNTAAGAGPVRPPLTPLGEQLEGPIQRLSSAIDTLGDLLNRLDLPS